MVQAESKGFAIDVIVTFLQVLSRSINFISWVCSSHEPRVHVQLQVSFVDQNTGMYISLKQHQFHTTEQILERKKLSDFDSL